MKDDNRLLYDLDDEEYDALSDEEKAEYSSSNDENSLEMMFPDGMDEN